MEDRQRGGDDESLLIEVTESHFGDFSHKSET